MLGFTVKTEEEGATGPSGAQVQRQRQPAAKKRPHEQVAAGGAGGAPNDVGPSGTAGGGGGGASSTGKKLKPAPPVDLDQFINMCVLCETAAPLSC